MAAVVVTGRLVALLQKLEVVDTGIEAVQSDVRQLSAERDNIRSTFDDLTTKLIHVQVYTCRTCSLSATGL